MFFIIVITFSTFSFCQKKYVSDIINETCSSDSANFFLDKFFNKTITDETKLVGIGEVCHGSKEAKLFENRMVDYLISKKQFNLLLLEFPDYFMQPVNYFLSNDSLKNYAMLDSIVAENFKNTFWNNQYTIKLLRWIKDFNLLHPNNKIKVKGIDLPSWGVSSFINNFLYKYIFPVEVEKVQELSFKWNSNYYSDSLKLKDEYTWFTANKNKLLIQYNKEEISLLEQYFADFLNGIFYNHLLTIAKNYPVKDSIWFRTSVYRDSVMAKNAISLLQNNKAIIMGHSIHLSSALTNQTLGYFLEQKYKKGYYKIITDFATASDLAFYNNRKSNADSVSCIKQYYPLANSAGYLLNNYSENCEGVYYFSELSSKGHYDVGFNTVNQYGEIYLLQNGFDALILFKKMHPLFINN